MVPTENFPEGPRIPKNSSKNTQEERRSAFFDQGCSGLFSGHCLPHIPLKRSLYRLVERKGKGFLTKSYIGNVWLPNEKREMAGKEGRGARHVA